MGQNLTPVTGGFRIVALGLVMAVAGCSQMGMNAPAQAPAQAPAAPATQTGVPAPATNSADSYDTSTKAEREAAQAAPSAKGTRLGTTVASLGDPTEGGFWLKTSLVSTETKGRVETEAGKSAQVTLKPSGGSNGGGSQLSLAALRVLGVSLTDLPTLTVYGS
ncbi:D-galactarate dehydratase [Rhodobacteraceae bacterium]|nr:D-galactarate dehydratase [Paracoccaceae bacterium]